MKKIATTFLLVLFSSLICKAQTPESENIVGSNHLIYSKILGEKRQIQIYLPPTYQETDAKYPVLYVLDGQLFFEYGVSLSKTFKQFKLAPEFIIVGIHTPFPQRYRQFGGGSENFMGFFEKELVPYIEESFRTNEEQIFFGWQYAASLGFKMMLNNPQAMSGYLLASPFPIWDQIDALDSISAIKSMLYFSVSPDEFQVNHGTEKLHAALSSTTIGGLDWAYAEFVNEEHNSTAFPTLYHGLRTYFKYYREFQVDNLQKFLAAGGLDHAYDYAKERGRKYGFSPDLSSWSKYTIIRSAIRAEELGHFQTFVEEFVTEDFIRGLKSRAIDIANFYEKHKDFQHAIDIYQMLLKDLPDSEDLLRRMGNAYLSIDNKEEAEKYFKRAAEISEGNN